MKKGVKNLFKYGKTTNNKSYPNIYSISFFRAVPGRDLSTTHGS